MHPILNIAIQAARRAGNVIQRYSTQLDRLAIETKGRNDFVTVVDRQAEAEIVSLIQKAFPDHSILGEETGLKENNATPYKWIIDPLDGTTNFLHGYPQFAVSIGVLNNNRLDQAVIFDPLRNELFSASRGEGAKLNDRRIRVSKTSKLDAALIGTGFPFRTYENLEVWIDGFRELLPKTSGVRRAGSAALDLAHVASGRLDGFWEIGLSPWDITAGCLLIQEAGGMVSDFSGKQGFLESGNVIAGNPKIYEEVFKTITRKIPERLRN
jgi:myo-inositol-1(or 4)-monophosphatase